ncbi:CC domain-containing protein [Caenorhabditis elegans]|nr:CC domain-containing protein [Caenorhabditis elegans]CCM09433.1 CC domain-containing protein [Caenorhabditis elegans]|eukprot:NP_001263861.1 Uncharacterized protein CELE_F58B4.3 [Caenorhabditis elegans]
MQNAAANCQNSSAFGVNGATCCCYGDGCNSSPKTGIVSAVGITLGFISLMKIMT